MGKSANEMAEQIYAGNWDKSQQIFKDSQSRSGGAERQYQESRGRNVDIANKDILGGGGYTEDQKGRILDEAGLESLPTSQDAYNRTYLTPEEQAGMTPDTERYTKYFDPEGMGRTQQAYQDQRIDADTTMGEQYSDAIGNDLYASGGYFDAMDSAVGSAEGRIDEFGDPTRLRADEAALDSIRMSPEEERQMVAGASKTVGNRMRAQQQQVDRAGRAAGLSAAGMSATRMRYARDTSAEAADAALQAKIAASGARASRAGYAESLRQGGEQASGNLATSQAFGLGGLKSDVAQRAESLRMSGVQDVSNRRIGQAQYQHQARTGTSAAVNQAKTQQQQFNAALGTEIATTQERDAAKAAGDIALNRQGTQQSENTSKLNQGAYVGEQGSRRNETVANAELQDTRAAKQYFKDDAVISAGRESDFMDKSLGATGQQAQGGLGAAQAKTQQQFAPTKFDKISGTILGGIKALSGV